MIWQILPWIVSLITLTTMWMAGNKSSKAWILGLVNQFLWATVLIHSELWGLLPTTIGVTFIYIRNFLKWRKDEHPGRNPYLRQGSGEDTVSLSKDAL